MLANHLHKGFLPRGYKWVLGVHFDFSDLSHRRLDFLRKPQADFQHGGESTDVPETLKKIATRQVPLRKASMRGCTQFRWPPSTARRRAVLVKWSWYLFRASFRLQRADRTTCGALCDGPEGHVSWPRGLSKTRMD